MELGNGLWVWMMPENKLKGKIEKIIKKFSAEFPSPLFVPHVTLTGSNDIDEKTMIKKTRELSRRIKPFKIKLGGLGYSDKYFSSLFVLAEKTKDLMDANLEARKLFSITEDGYVPHMSLIYNDRLSEEEKKNIIRKLGKIEGEFKVRSLRLQATLGPVEKWRKIKDFSLHP